jgi:hypothetical protein
MREPRGDRELPVTATAPGHMRDNPLVVTALAERETQEHPHCLTCTFPRDRRVVVQVYSAPSAAEARAAVQTLWWKRQDTVEPGDENHGHMQPFTLIFPRHTHTGRFGKECRTREEGGSTCPSVPGSC